MKVKIAEITGAAERSDMLFSKMFPSARQIPNSDV
jgi:hypothetical protein